MVKPRIFKRQNISLENSSICRQCCCWVCKGSKYASLITLAESV